MLVGNNSHNNNGGDRMLSKPQMAKKLEVSESTIDRLIVMGVLRQGIKVSERCRRWKESWGDEYIAACEAGTVFNKGGKP